MITAERSIIIGFGILFWTSLVAGVPWLAFGLLGLCFLFIYVGGLDRVSRKWEPVSGQKTRPDKEAPRRPKPKRSPPTQEMRH